MIKKIKIKNVFKKKPSEVSLISEHVGGGDEDRKEIISAMETYIYIKRNLDILVKIYEKSITVDC